MQMTLVKYRTIRADELIRTDKWNWEYAVVPTIFLSDLLKWLSDTEAELAETTDNVQYDARLPINWPSYETCSYCMQVSDALHCVL